MSSPELSPLKLDLLKVTDYERLKVIIVFINHRGDIGVPEKTIINESGVSNPMYHVARLEQAGFLSSGLLQTGTAGPYERYYRFPANSQVVLETTLILL